MQVVGWGAPDRDPAEFRVFEGIHGVSDLGRVHWRLFSMPEISSNGIATENQPESINSSLNAKFHSDLPEVSRKVETTFRKLDSDAQ